MANILFANNAATTIASALGPGGTSVTVAAGTGATFPNPSGGNYFVATLVSAANNLVNEIVHVTARSGDTLTLVRAQEGTSALSWSVGDQLNNFLTAGSLQALLAGSALLAEPGYYVTPFGLILQWGTASFNSATNLQTVALPLPFPTAMLFGVMSDRAGYAYQYGIGIGSDLSHVSCFCPTQQIENGVIVTRSVTATGSFLVGGY